jgi:hypothetical protein
MSKILIICFCILSCSNLGLSQKISLGAGFGTSLLRFDLNTQIGKRAQIGVSFIPRNKWFEDSFTPENSIGFIFNMKTLQSQRGFLYYGIEPGIAFVDGNRYLIGTIGLGFEGVLINRRIKMSMFIDNHIGYTTPNLLSFATYYIDALDYHSLVRITTGLRFSAGNNRFYSNEK